MAKRVIMPKLGQTVEESVIVQWLKKEGDEVHRGDILLEIETDKANMEVESFVDGSLLKILRHEGETVPVMEVIAYVGAPGEPVPEKPSSEKASKPESTFKAERPAVSPRETSRKTFVREAPSTMEPVPPVSMHVPTPTESEASVFRISPRAAKLARDSVIDPRRIRGSGPAGRILECDVAEYLRDNRYDQIQTSPAAKRLAAEHGLDLLRVQSDGPGTRIRTSDIRRVLSEQPRPLPRIRQIIAERLTHSFTTTPHFYVTVSVDVDDLLELRSKLKGEGRIFTLTDFILKAAALTLLEFPMVNSSTTDGKLVQHRTGIHLGLAVSVEEGLLVPVIRHADRLTLGMLHEQVEELVLKTREGKLSPDEITGSTFTISNMGMLDVENFAAIINPGESSILAVSSVTRTPVVREECIVIRSIMKMTLSADHRLVDGALAARFINATKNKLEDLELWKRSI